MRHHLRRHAALLVVILAGCAVLLWKLDARYLWQDEAAAAVMGERMMRYGKPLGYDGRNLITMDYLLSEEMRAVVERTRGADRAIRFYVERGDFREDTAWIGQPWGQFLLAGLSLRLLGHGTLQARLPFALAGVLTVVLLHRLVRRRFGDPTMAAIAVGLLLANVFWVLHARQCRYYAGASLFLLATVIAYLRWSGGARFGAASFVAAGWCLFQFDFGTFWPVLGVLGADALLFRRRSLRATAIALGGALLAVAPWAFYYELWGRLKVTSVPGRVRLIVTLFNVNQFELPLLFVPLIVWLAWRSKREERQLVGVSLAILIALLVWVPIVAPHPYHRYVVAATPLCTLLLAFAIVRGTALVMTRPGPPRTLVAVCLAGVLAVSPIASDAVSLWIRPSFLMPLHDPGRLLRGELAPAWHELSGRAPDPNRTVIEFLRPLLHPEDEILVTYEDAPFMFYTEQRIRGGIPAFRVADRRGEPPRFAVVRRSAVFLDWGAFRRELGFHRWQQLPVAAPDVPFGNSPDPSHRFFPRPREFPDLMVLERITEEQKPSPSDRG